MRMVDLIGRKRDGQAFTEAEIAFFVRGYTRGEVPDYQAAAWAMAVFLRGMEPAEVVSLTREMLHSGDVLDWSDLSGPKVDKHSTGGVGDKTSLILAPIAAAAGVRVPMISGRGLGHTGGTLDKLESIPGFDVRLSRERFREVLVQTGLVLAGQTAEVAPADRKLYALRDVTATVESIPLITSSILSKKLAAGIEALVLDVKVGRGAFMKTEARARELAESLVRVGSLAGLRVVALLTDMDQPLGTHVGNALEVQECAEILQGGRAESDLARLSFELAAWMLLLGRVEPDLEAARRRVEVVVQSGAAFLKLAEVVLAQGGDPDALSDFDRLPRARSVEAICALRAGIVARLDAAQVGVAAMLLGAGRATVDDAIDPAAGVVLARKQGERVEAGEELAWLHHNSDRGLAEARALLSAAFAIGDTPLEPKPLFRGVIER